MARFSSDDQLSLALYSFPVFYFKRIKLVIILKTKISFFALFLSNILSVVLKVVMGRTIALEFGIPHILFFPPKYHFMA